jgi:1-acyl-sn-glycerol-3-phosphate acyltransferase
MSALRTWLWILVSCLFVVLFGIPLILSRLINRRLPWLIGKSWGAFELWLLKMICGLSFTVEGTENIGEQPGVALIKHSSAYETLAQLVIFPQQCWVLKQQLIWSPFFGWALMALGAIPIDRSAGRNAVSKVIAIGKERIEQGNWVAIFPEGTRVPAGETKRWGISGILLAQAAHVDIVPVAHNSGYFWPKEGWTIRPGKIRFVIGKSVSPVGKDPRELAETLRSWVDTETEKLTPAD